MHWKQFNKARHVNRKFLLIQLVLIAVVIVSSTSLSAQSKRLITSIAWSPDGSKIAIGGGPSVCDPDDSTPYDVKIIDANTQETLHTLTGFHCHVTSLDWSLDRAKVAVSSLDAFGVRVWGSLTGELLTTSQIGGQGVTDLKWHPSGNQLAFATVSNAIVFMDPMTGEFIEERHPPIGGLRLDWSPDGSKLVGASGYYNEAHIGDMTSYEIGELIGHTDAISGVDWSPDGAKIATGSWDKTVRIWDSKSGKPLLTLNDHQAGITDVEWRPALNQLASADASGVIIVWDITDGQQIEQFQGVEIIHDIAWNPKGTQLAYADADGILKITTPALKSASDSVSRFEPSYSSVASDIKSLILRLFIQLFN